MMGCLKWVAVTVTLLWGVGGIAAAQPVVYPKATDALPEGSDRTYLDLLRLVVPRITVADSTYSGGGTIKIRHIQGWNDSNVEIAQAGDLRLAAVPLPADRADRMVLLIDFGATEFNVGFAILALFDIRDEPTLVDSADISFDRWTSFMEPVRLSVGAGHDLLVTGSTHHNASQDYATTALLLVRNNRLSLIDTIRLLSERECSFVRSQRLSIEKGAAEPVADIVATVTVLTEPTGDDCSGGTIPEPGSRMITVTYRWDAAAQQYRPDSDGFQILARENEERF